MCVSPKTTGAGIQSELHGCWIQGFTWTSIYLCPARPCSVLGVPSSLSRQGLCVLLGYNRATAAATHIMNICHWMLLNSFVSLRMQFCSDSPARILDAQVEHDRVRGVDLCRAVENHENPHYWNIPGSFGGFCPFVRGWIVKTPKRSVMCLMYRLTSLNLLNLSRFYWRLHFKLIYIANPDEICQNS